MKPVLDVLPNFEITATGGGLDQGDPMLAGERHLVVPAASEAAFRRALREVGYLVAAGEVGTVTPRR